MLTQLVKAFILLCLTPVIVAMAAMFAMMCMTAMASLVMAVI